eukprot:CAMPEP_0115884748 /NCGR_PEP_ID=MMETSP0287-20121206/30291_1 /TAXON_ID=412157 /ORGANISM="Chrysochromulina rotalis, Strain UIO044" /LENGTH=44 /DNA_ID= /DNA_START= /DNA_END= /DNA_ORIENTATION=
MPSIALCIAPMLPRSAIPGPSTAIVVVPSRLRMAKLIDIVRPST